MLGKLVSVIVPTYNRPELLMRCIQSILFQTYPYFEIIIVDDASLGDYSEVTKECANRGLTYIRLDHHKGPARARNCGIQLAQGQLIAFNDDDDVWDREKLKKQVELIEQAADNAGLVFSKYKKIFRDGSQIEISPAQQLTDNWHKSLLRYNFIGTPTVLMKRECFAKAGTFNEDLPCLEDWDLWIRVSNIYSLLYLPENLVSAYESQDSRNANEKDNAIAHERIMNNYLDEISKDKKLLSAYYWRIGIANEAIHDYQRSLVCFVKSFYHHRRFSTMCRIAACLSKCHNLARTSSVKSCSHLF